MSEEKILYKDLSYRIIGAAMEVHRELGPGFPEAIYDEAFAMALRAAGIAFDPQKEMRVTFRGIVLAKSFRPDYDIDGKIIVDLKAKTDLPPEDVATMLSYLRASGRRLGMLINFGRVRLQYERVLL